MGELRQGYIAKWKHYPTDEVKIRVARPSVLGPSKKLLDDAKASLISWDDYARRFRKEMMYHTKPIKKIDEIIDLLKTENVRLICYEKHYPCHRFLLMDIISERAQSLGLDYIVVQKEEEGQK